MDTASFTTASATTGPGRGASAPAPAASASRRRLAAAAAAAGAAGVAIAGLLATLLPEQSPFAAAMPGLLGIAGPAAGPIELGLGLAALAAVATLAVLRRREPAPLEPWQRREPAPLAIRIAVGALGAAIALTLPGSAMALAGYLLALVLLVAVPVLLVLLSLRRPWIGVPLVALLAAGVAAGELTGAFPISAFGGALLTGLDRVWVALVTVAAHVVAAVGMLALVAPTPESGLARRLTDAVRRARVPVTLLAAACGLPYLIARASWLTPWPLFGPTREMLDRDPATMVTGLLLGSAMLAGILLTLGLILPWGERFPRWAPGVGGRPVPVRLAVVPALLVAVLFTVGGIAMLDLGAAMEGSGGSINRLTMWLVLPFWLWGPLLALATWGYAVHRREIA